MKKYLGVGITVVTKGPIMGPLLPELRLMAATQDTGRNQTGSLKINTPKAPESIPAINRLSGHAGDWQQQSTLCG